MTHHENITRAAVKLIRNGMNPTEAYVQAAMQEDTTPSVRNKGCPKYALISLAEHGHLKGVHDQTPSRPLTVGAQLVLAGKKILDETPSLAGNKTLLWQKVCESTDSTRTSQAGLLDVLLALWKHGDLQS